ncbi:hypothetical protein F3C99_14255 [Vitellibacter sp. q18]|nr:hypothetical protein [Aequorivita lutea]
MKKIIGFLLLLLILSGCDKNETNFQREVSIFNGTILIRNENFNGTITKKENSLIYKYVSQQDSSKTIVVKFDKTSGKLFFAMDEYQKVSERNINEHNLSSENFYYFDLENSYPDATGPILFNEKYGLLAIYNVYGPTIILLKNKEDKKIANRILNN